MSNDDDVAQAVLDYADSHFWGYRTRMTADGMQVVPQYCPICGGGDGYRKDKWTFAIGLNGGANCKRGNCQWKGSLNDLLKMDGKEPVKMSKKGGRMDHMGKIEKKKLKRYVLPKTEILPLTEKCREYLHLRGFSDKTIDDLKFASDKDGNLAIQFFESGDLVYLKFRHPQKFVKGSGKQKEWQESQTEPILWNMDGISFKQPVILTEGMCDAASVYEAGFTNVTSIPCGCDNMDWIDNCWDFIRKVKTWILFGDADAPGQELVETLKQRLAFSQVYYVPLEAYPTAPDGHVCKDANEILARFGKEKIAEVIESAEETRIDGLIDFADIPDEDEVSAHRIFFGIPGLDNAIGGMKDGGLTIVTGDAGSGKSTAMGVTIINAIEAGETVCCYSGELSKIEFRQWLVKQAAGDDWVGLQYDPQLEKNVPSVAMDVRKRIGEHFRGKLYLYDNETDAKDGIVNTVVSLFEVAACRYGAKLMIVDNLMSLTFGTDGDENAIQSQMINRMKDFSLKFNVHVMIVAHLRKVSTSGRREVTLHDIQGSSTTVKAASEVILVDNQKFKILKNRGDGTTKIIEFCYCPASRRVYQANIGDKLVCNWDKTGLTLPEPRADSLEEYRVKLPPADDPI